MNGGARGFLEAILGPDWDERLIIDGAMAGPGASDDEVDAARKRVVEIAEDARPDLEWTDEMRGEVMDAWFEAWVDVPLSSHPDEFPDAPDKAL